MNTKAKKEHSTATRSILRFSGAGAEPAADRLAVEAPLEIQLEYGPANRRQREQLAVTLRTPGHDLELALGLLLAEGIIGRKEDVWDCREYPNDRGGTILVRLAGEVEVSRERLDRQFAATASCGLCGKTSVDSIYGLPLFPLRPGRPKVQTNTLLRLAGQFEKTQFDFQRTGGMHAAALFQADGRLLALREDIGRHNALDKLMGYALLEGAIPLHRQVVLLSGRAGFELVQKAAMGGVPVLAAVGAASSMAVDMALETGMTLLGFLRPDRFNCYAGAERLA